jgi:hypothetical protein
MIAPALPTHLTGGCQCGACRYEVDAPPLFGYVCHCLECRRQSGAAFSASILVPAAALSASGPLATWIREEADDPPLEALFCPLCGVRLVHHAVPRQDVARVKAGTLDDADWFRPAAEFFAKRRFAWVDLGGDTVECAERAEDHGALLAAWQVLFPPSGASS